MTKFVSPVEQGPRRLHWVVSAVVSVLPLVLTWPTLTWIEFSSDVENISVATAREVRRTGNWLLPTLQGEPRVRKPPLTTWLTAASMRPWTLDGLTSADPQERDAARKSILAEARWPSLIASCLMIFAACELGRLLLGPAGGPVTGLIASTSYLYFRYCGFAVTDVQLGLWSTIGNVALAHVVFERGRWKACLGAGTAIALGFMSKGPIVLLLTIVPLIAFLAWRRWQLRPLASPRQSSLALPAIVATVVAVTIGLSWFGFVFVRDPATVRTWWWEVTRSDPTETPTSRWFSYLAYLPAIAPWTVFLIGGIYDALLRTRGSDARGDERSAARVVFALGMLVLPVVVMSFFRDRKVRYLYPLCVPGAVLAAHALIGLARTAGSRWKRPVLGMHWALLTFVGLAFPLAAARGWPPFTTAEGAAWFSTRASAMIAMIVAVVLITGGWFALAWRWRWATLVTTVLVMSVVRTFFAYGYREGEGKSQMMTLADLIIERYPDAEIYDVRDGRKRIPADLSVYADRRLCTAKSVRAIRRSDRPQVYTAFQRRTEPEPSPERGWQYLAKGPRGDNWWVAFVRVPRLVETRSESKLDQVDANP